MRGSEQLPKFKEIRFIGMNLIRNREMCRWGKQKKGEMLVMTEQK